MFIMTSDIRIGKYISIKPNAVKWKCSVSNFTDTCTIKLPLATYTVHNATSTPDVSTEAGKKTVFEEGDKVSVALGYDGENTQRFKGFVARINYATPLELECEGYSYELKKKLFTKSYKTTTVKNILIDLTAGTSIKLSKYIPDVVLRNVNFKNAPGLKVLEWFQKECLCVVYFEYDTLFVGASKFAIPKPSQKLRLGWNTVEDRELKLSVEKTETLVHVIEKDAKGQTKRTKAKRDKYDNIKDVKVRAGLPDNYLADVVSELQHAETYSGYRGDITCFLIPSFEKGYVALVNDVRFPARTGSYFVESVDGSFDSGGGRQKLTLRRYAN